MKLLHDRSSVWIGLADLLLCVVSVVIVAVNPKTPQASGVQEKAEYLITMESSVDIDADPDLHMLGPSRKPVFYAARDVGCARLDSDPRGFIDNVVRLADGSQVKAETDKETISLRCIEPGRYDLAVNLYDYKDQGVSLAHSARRDLSLKVHCEIVGLNPQVRVIYARDVTLDWVGQTINWASFDMGRDGAVTLVDPPLEPITRAYQRQAGESRLFRVEARILLFECGRSRSARSGASGDRPPATRLGFAGAWNGSSGAANLIAR